ncbi:hypothetical protein NQD34_003374 [Periophthalmus magnuspinnatus]|nr:hypothetical protein NQD34_003374 [Periophthalmus magnuspinnatus]
MVHSCCGSGCTNQHPKDEISLYRLPADPERRDTWASAVK